MYGVLLSSLFIPFLPLSFPIHLSTSHFGFHWQDALDVAKGALLRDNKEEYVRQAKECVANNASDATNIKEKFFLL